MPQKLSSQVALILWWQLSLTGGCVKNNASGMSGVTALSTRWGMLVPPEICAIDSFSPCVYLVTQNKQKMAAFTQRS